MIPLNRRCSASPFLIAASTSRRTRRVSGDGTQSRNLPIIPFFRKKGQPEDRLPTRTKKTATSEGDALACINK